MNHAQRQLRTISDHHADDTAGELAACEAADIAFRLTKAALADRQVTTTEALSIFVAQQQVMVGCDLSLARNLEIQREIDATIAWLGSLPAHALATLPRPGLCLVEDAPLFRADGVCDADMRRRHPELGRATVGQMVRSDDWGEAA